MTYTKHLKALPKFSIYLVNEWKSKTDLFILMLRMIYFQVKQII